MKQDREMFSRNVIYKNDGSIYQFAFSETRDRMMELLVEETKKVGRVMTFKEFSAIPDAPQPNEYARYGWTSFDEAAEEAWQMLQGPIQVRLTEEGKKLATYLREHPMALKPTKKESDPTPIQKPITKIGPIPRFD